MNGSVLTVDFHNHVIPAVDDGAQDADGAREGVRALYDDGVRDLIAGVHIDASQQSRPAEWRERLAHIDRQYEELQDIVAEHFPELRLHRGAEVKLDTPDADLSDERLRLAGGRFVLVEFGGFQAPPYGDRLLEQVRDGGWVPVLAHPERYRGARDLVQEARAWIGVGAHLQLNHGSLDGRYGPEVRDAARALLAAGLISYVSSDFHSRRRTWISQTTEAIRAAPAGAEVLDMLELNARRLLDGEEPLPVPPLRLRRGLLGRLGGLFGGG